MRTIRIVLAPRTRNTRAIGLLYAGREMYARSWRMSRENSPGSRVARARTETSIPGFRWGILAGYLWKLNPPILFLGEGDLLWPPDILGISSSIRRPSPWWSPFIKCPLSEPLEERISPRYFATPRGFSASFSRAVRPRPLPPPPVRSLSCEFRLNESPRRLHRFAPIIRSTSDAG